MRLNPPDPPRKHFDCPYNQYNPSSYIIIRQHSQNAQMCTNTKKCQKKRAKMQKSAKTEKVKNIKTSRTQKLPKNHKIKP